MKHIYPARVKCLADREGLQEFQIDGVIVHAEDEDEALDVRREMDVQSDTQPEPESTPDLFA